MKKFILMGLGMVATVVQGMRLNEGSAMGLEQGDRPDKMDEVLAQVNEFSETQSDGSGMILDGIFTLLNTMEKYNVTEVNKTEFKWLVKHWLIKTYVK